MAQKFFTLLDDVFSLMIQNKLRKDIDDTLLEKLLTMLSKCRYQRCSGNEDILLILDGHVDMYFDFLNELVMRTKALHLIMKVIPSIAEKSNSYAISIQTFTLRLLGMVLEHPSELYSLQDLMNFPLFRNRNGKIINDHIPTVQDALLFCLSCITKHLKGVVWFISQNLEEFVFSSFTSTSYYVRKSCANFFVNLISRYVPFISNLNACKEPEQMLLKDSFQKIVTYITCHIHFYRTSDEIVFAESCIYVLKKLHGIDGIECIMNDYAKMTIDIAECFIDLSEEEMFNIKLTDMFLDLYSKSSVEEKVMHDVIKCLIIKEDVKLFFSLASSYASMAWQGLNSQWKVTLFLLPAHFLINASLSDHDNFFQFDSKLIYNFIQKKMENETDCKLLFCASLSALQKSIPILHSEQYRENVATTIQKVVKMSGHPNHKWLCSVLENRNVHQSFLDLFSSFFGPNVYQKYVIEGSDLILQSIIEFLMRPSSDSNFLSELLLLVKDALIFFETMKFHIKDVEKEHLIQILFRMLHDKRESIVDSAIHVAGQIINNTAWQEHFSKYNIHSITWDIAILGSHDSSARCTALKIIIEGCFQLQCLSKIKALKGVTEEDIVKILFDLTYNPDSFLQKEALSCLFSWVKLKWNDLSPSCIEYLFSALVCAIKSLDMELKLISLSVWLWFLEEKFSFPSELGTSKVKDYIEELAYSGFGLSLTLALEDPDEAVQFKAAGILYKLQSILKDNDISVNSLALDLAVQEEEECQISSSLHKTCTTDERGKGLDIVMELSTSEQISNISQPLSFSETYNFKQEYHSINRKDRICSAASLWTCLWSEKLMSVLHSEDDESDINSGSKSLLSDIILAEISENLLEDTPDCY